MWSHRESYPLTPSGWHSGIVSGILPTEDRLCGAMNFLHLQLCHAWLLAPGFPSWPLPCGLASRPEVPIYPFADRGLDEDPNCQDGQKCLVWPAPGPAPGTAPFCSHISGHSLLHPAPATLLALVLVPDQVLLSRLRASPRSAICLE